MMCRAKKFLTFRAVPYVLLNLCVIFVFMQPLEASGFLNKNRLNTPPDKIGDTEQSYKVEIIVPSGAPSEGMKIVKSVSSLVADQSKTLRSSSGLLAKARSDYGEILSALYADGRYGGVISIRVNGSEAANLSPLTQLPPRSNIAIVIDAGPQYVFGSVRVNEATAFTKQKAGKILSIDDLGYKVGSVAKSKIIRKAERWAIEGWQKQGYAKARIVRRDVIVDHAARRVDTQIVIDPGKKSFYGPLNVRNISKHPRMDSAYVAWMTGLIPGQKYDPDALDKANKQLVRLGVFRSVNIHEADATHPDGHLPLTLTVDERKPRRFGVGGNYSTLDGAGFETYWMHSNLSGRAESLKADLKITGVGSHKTKSYDPEDLNYLVGVTFVKPGIVTPDTNFKAELKIRRDILDDYVTEATRGKLGITHIFNPDLSGQVDVAISNSRLRDDSLKIRKFTTIGLQSSLIYDSRDDKLNATKGLYNEVVIEPFYEARFNNFVTKMTTEGRAYWAFDARGRSVFATRMKFGAIIGDERAQLPLDTLFFSGGGGSVRGYAYRDISVKTESGSVIGGRSLIEMTAELRFSFHNKIGFVGFIDGGSVGEKTDFNFSQKMKWGVGIGGRYMTNLGPLRFDLAFPLKREERDPRIGFYVGIGQAF